MVEESFASKILKIEEDGKRMRDEFEQSSVKGNSKNDRLSRVPIYTFKTYSTSVIKCQHFANTIEVNRDIIGTLLSFSIRNERAIDIPSALVYPLAPAPLSLAHGNGKKRETPKSKLMKLLVADTTKKDPRSDVSLKSIKKKDKSFVIDLIAAIRTMTKFIGDLPKG